MSQPSLHHFSRAVVTITPPQPIGMVDVMMLVMIPITGNVGDDSIVVEYFRTV